MTNRGAERVNLVVVFPKKIGSRHKTLYSFKREPDRRPGALYVWDLDLAPGKGEHISFHLDTEYPRFGDYNAYEAARHAL